MFTSLQSTARPVGQLEVSQSAYANFKLLLAMGSGYSIRQLQTSTTEKGYQILEHRCICALKSTQKAKCTTGNTVTILGVEIFTKWTEEEV
jgi:hypothetical protein